MEKINFEKWLEERFVAMNEVNGVPIIKDNFEDLFSEFINNFNSDDWFDWGTLFAKDMFVNGKQEMLNNFKDK